MSFSLLLVLFVSSLLSASFLTDSDDVFSSSSLVSPSAVASTSIFSATPSSNFFSSQLISLVSVFGRVQSSASTCVVSSICLSAGSSFVFAAVVSSTVTSVSIFSEQDFVSVSGAQSLSDLFFVSSTTNFSSEDSSFLSTAWSSVSIFSCVVAEPIFPSSSVAADSDDLLGSLVISLSSWLVVFGEEGASGSALCFSSSSIFSVASPLVVATKESSFLPSSSPVTSTFTATLLLSSPSFVIDSLLRPSSSRLVADGSGVFSFGGGGGGSGLSSRLPLRTANTNCTTIESSSDVFTYT
uniref:Putative secreted protein n=1 Tax=Anopheles darlingi TaxID=43151 RepID=A0A2M4DCY8_ANODA